MQKEGKGKESRMIEREPKPFEDYAKVPVEDLPKHKRTRGGGGGTHFPTLLHLVLTRAEKDGYSHICAWQSHGRCFSVFNRDLFVSEVMPNYFRQSQFASFQRQLNLYGFQRLSQKSLDHGSYYHEMFLRTRADLCHGIFRAKEKDLRAQKAARQEPDFHKMERMPQITDKDIGTAESILMQEKTSVEEEQQKTALVEDSLSLIEEKGDPLANLFQTIAMNGIDTSDSWMEPRPIAPGGLGSTKSHQQPVVKSEAVYRPIALPKPAPLPLPSFLIDKGQDPSHSTGSSRQLSLAPASTALVHHPEILRKVSDEKLSEKRPGCTIEGRSNKRQADEASHHKCFDEDEPMEEVAGMVSFLEDVDFD